MFGIGPGEAFLIGCVAIVLIRPEELPKLIRQMGVFYGEIQRWLDVIKDEINTLGGHDTER